MQLVLSAIFFLSCFVFFGFKIHSAEAADGNALYAKLSKNKVFEKYKTEWQKYNQLPVAKIKEIDLNLILFPSQNSMMAEGKYLLKNENEKAIDTILVRLGFDELTELDWNGQAQLIKADSLMKSYLYVLQTPLLSGNSIELKFKIRDKENDLFSRNSNVLSNGSFIKSDFLPRLGYQFGASQIPLSDSLDIKHNFYYKDADQTILRTTISTDDNQMAIAPGKLISQESNGWRNVYTYETIDPVKFNFSFHTGDFRRIGTQHQDVEISILCHQNHEKNTADMFEGIKAALDYNTARFGAYPYEDIRITEFPNTEESYAATLSANNIPTSEILFNVNTKDLKSKINMPFYVMAHELTHEWFGNQVMPADMEGAKMLTESITEYISLCIYREKFGEAAAQDFLEKQHDRYHRGRKRYKSEELPLYKMKARQDYIAYGKGAIQLNALANKIGSKKMDDILKTYLNRFKNNSNKYPNSMDFLQIVKTYTSENQHDWIDELFMSTVYYENSIKDLKKLDGNKIQLTINMNIENERDFVVQTPQSIDLGIFDQDMNLINIETLDLKLGENVIQIEVNSSASIIELDPFLNTIDEDRGNNKIIL